MDEGNARNDLLACWLKVMAFHQQHQQLQQIVNSSQATKSQALSKHKKTSNTHQREKPAKIEFGSLPDATSENGFDGGECKPAHSYIGLIALGILESKEKQLVLADIYQWIVDRYPYFRSRGQGWRNSIRHNLSLNECFVKAGRSENGKGHYWAIHPANMEDFTRGDFRRKRAQRKVRRAMGLLVDDCGSSDDEGPTTMTSNHSGLLPASPAHVFRLLQQNSTHNSTHPTETRISPPIEPSAPPKKRKFDMASLLSD